MATDKHVVVVEGPDVKVVFNEDKGVTSNYYGGQGKPDGPGHGHTDVDTSGNITYHRDPDDE